MLEELTNASKQLRASLEHYLNTCSSIRDHCLQGSGMNAVPLQDAALLDHELDEVDYYASNLQKSKFAIKVTRNHTPSISPISRLPPEVLVRIFHMICDVAPRTIDCLPHVCFRWRSVALGSQSLWTYLYFRPESSRSADCEINRVCHYASRSGQLPIDFYFSANSVAYGDYAYDTHAENVCQLVAPRMRSLYLDYLKLDSYFNGHEMRVRATRALSTLLSSCTPGIFTNFILNSDHLGFITVEEDGDANDSAIKVNLQHEDLDEIFPPINVLHLTGAFLRWTNHAYHGLVDLRLYAARSTRGPQMEEVNTISETQLVCILKASPALRILHFGLRITSRTGKGDPVPRGRLEELETLHVSTLPDARFGEIGRLLRLLKPGPRPLHLSINRSGPPAEERFSMVETRSFFRRANVTKLYANRLPYFMNFLTLLPNLKVLILSGLSPALPIYSNSSDAYCQVTYPQLHTCFLLRCKLELEGLPALTQHCRPRTITLAQHACLQSHYDEDEDEEMEMMKEELSGICSDVRVTNDYASLGEHQDLLPGH